MSTCRNGAGQNQGFTLIELIAVIAIMALILGVAVTSMVGIRNGSEMRSAVTTVRSSLSLARQYSVLNREKVYFSILSEQVYVISNCVVGVTNGILGATNSLPPGIKFTTSPFLVTFNPNGGADSAITCPITLHEVTEKAGNTKDVTITVYGLTGLTKTPEMF